MIRDNHKPLIFRTPEGQILDIPADGFLGLLALGAVGVKAWREKRQAIGAESHWFIKPQEDEKNTAKGEHDG